MVPKKIKIYPEYSAQPSIAKPNPLLEVSIQYILSNRNPQKIKLLKIVDYGCGKLRHLHVFFKYFNTIYLVDTEIQLSRVQRLFGEKTSVTHYIDNLRTSKKMRVFNNHEFESLTLAVDIVFSIAVFDVVLPHVRRRMIKASYKNLKKGGYFVVIIPRNDSSILKRCSENNKYADGHIFHHHGIVTFFKNFSETKHLINKITKIGFVLSKDLSRYRNVCLIFEK